MDLSSLVEGLPRGAAFHPGTRQVRSRPIRFLELLHQGVRHFRRHPLITGLSDRLVWTAGPVSSPLCNSAHWQEQAKASFAFFWRAPYSLLAQSHILWPGLPGERKAHRNPILLTDEMPVSWKVPVLGTSPCSVLSLLRKQYCKTCMGFQRLALTSAICVCGFRRSELHRFLVDSGGCLVLLEALPSGLRY